MYVVVSEVAKVSIATRAGNVVWLNQVIVSHCGRIRNWTSAVPSPINMLLGCSQCRKDFGAIWALVRQCDNAFLPSVVVHSALMADYGPLVGEEHATSIANFCSGPVCQLWIFHEIVENASKIDRITNQRRIRRKQSDDRERQRKKLGRLGYICLMSS